LRVGGYRITRAKDSRHFVAVDNDDAVGDHATGSVDDGAKAERFGLCSGSRRNDEARDGASLEFSEYSHDANIACRREIV
jgi:hypothetical protein